MNATLKFSLLFIEILDAIPALKSVKSLTHCLNFMVTRYLEHGLVITHIYTVIEYIPNAAFNSFMKQVAQAHLDGDHDKDKALATKTMKLIGNSSYG